MWSGDAGGVGLMADHRFVQIVEQCISQMARIQTKADQSNIYLYRRVLLLFSIAPLEENTGFLVEVFLKVRISKNFAFGPK